MRRHAFFAVTAGLVLVAGLVGSTSPAPPRGFLIAFQWSTDDARFGGFSGLEVAENGLDFVVLSDRGALTTGRFSRNETGKIASISAQPMMILKGNNDAPLAKARGDSEGIALGQDGSIFVSFEGVARVLRYSTPGGVAENLPTPKDFKSLQRNASLEALAVDQDGVLYTLPERSGRDVLAFPVYRFGNGRWDSKLRIPRSASYLPVGADFGPDGRFYLLERDFRGLAGFASRLRRFIVTPQGLGNEQILIETPPGLHDNLESVSIWRDQAGHLIATMISDDNFNFFQKTEIVEYQLPD